MMAKCLGNAIKTCEFGQNSGKVGTILSQNCPLLTTWHKCGINLVIRGFDGFGCCVKGFISSYYCFCRFFTSFFNFGVDLPDLIEGILFEVLDFFVKGGKVFSHRS